MEVDKYGNILNWPDGFFGDMEKDMYEQAMMAINRRIKEEMKDTDEKDNS